MRSRTTAAKIRPASCPPRARRLVGTLRPRPLFVSRVVDCATPRLRSSSGRRARVPSRGHASLALDVSALRSSSPSPSPTSSRVAATGARPDAHGSRSRSRRGARGGWSVRDAARPRVRRGVLRGRRPPHCGRRGPGPRRRRLPRPPGSAVQRVRRRGLAQGAARRPPRGRRRSRGSVVPGRRLLSRRRGVGARARPRPRPGRETRGDRGRADVRPPERVRFRPRRRVRLRRRDRQDRRRDGWRGRRARLCSPRTPSPSRRTSGAKSSGGRRRSRRSSGGAPRRARRASARRRGAPRWSRRGTISRSSRRCARRRRRGKKRKTADARPEDARDRIRRGPDAVARAESGARGEGARDQKGPTGGARGGSSGDLSRGNATDEGNPSQLFSFDSPSSRHRVGRRFPPPPARCLRAASPERVPPPLHSPFLFPLYEERFHAVSLSVLFLSLVSRIFSSTRATISL